MPSAEATIWSDSIGSRLEIVPDVLSERARHIISFFRSTSMGVSANIQASFHGSKYTSMEISMEVGGKRFASMGISMEVGWNRFTSMEVRGIDLLPWKLVEASMEIHGNFHCRWKWKFPLLPSIASSTNICRGSFHELPYTPTYFHLLP